MNSRSLITLTAICTLLAPALPALADDTPAVSIPADILRVGDAALGEIRGRYAPAAPNVESALPAPSISGNLAGVHPLSAAGTAGAVMSPSGIGAGAITAVGVSLTSTWQTAAGDTYAAGVNVLVDPNAATEPSVETWSSHVAGAAPATSLAAINTVSTAPLPVAGVGQSVQIAGDGNSAANQATVSFVSGTPVMALSPGGNTCTAGCTTSVGPAGIGVLLSLPGGTAGQSIGAAGIAQNIAIGSDANAVINSLHLQLQTAAPRPGVPTAPNLSSFLPGLLIGVPIHP